MEAVWKTALRNRRGFRVLRLLQQRQHPLLAPEVGDAFLLASINKGSKSAPLQNFEVHHRAEIGVDKVVTLQLLRG
jgi:hypothetical protein